MKLNHDGAKFKTALARKLGLDPEHTTNIQASWTSGHDMVEVTWEGIDLMNVQVFQDLMDEVRREVR